MRRSKILMAMMLAAVTWGCADKKQPPENSGWGTHAIPDPVRPAPPPPVKREALNQPLRDLARKTIDDAFKSEDPILRANAVEAAQNVFGLAALDGVGEALKDKAPIVRFAGSMAAGKLQLADLHDRLRQLADDPDPKVRIGARYALHRLGDFRLSHDLELTAKDPNPRIREDTAMVLGLLGNPSALKILRDMRGDSDANVRLQVAESMWRLHDESALEPLGAALISQFADDQMLAVMALVAPRDMRVSGHVMGKLTSDWIEVDLVAARALGELGMDDGYAIALKSVGSADPRQRLLAALALGSIGRSDAQTKLAPLMTDPEPRVRVAAAQAILQLKEP